MFCCFRKSTNKELKVTMNITNENGKVIEKRNIPITPAIPRLLNYIKYNQHEVEKCVRIVDWNDTIPFIPPITKGQVIKVYDGDTITIATKLPYENSELYRFQIRLNGIDCPEIKSHDENEKECAKIAKNMLSELLLNKHITLKNISTEKYGRILATVYLDDININDLMLKKRLAVSYDGKTKYSPKNWLDYYYNNVID